MSANPVLDDLAIEAIIRGDDVAADVGHLAAFAARVRAVGHGPAPRPTPALARLLADGGAATARVDISPDGRHRSRRRRSLAKVAGLSVVAKVGLGATAAAATVVGAGAASMLPGDPGRMARHAIEVVTPVQFGDHDDVGIVGDDPEHGDGAEHGERVSSDATGESDGVPGVDGGEVSDGAPGASRRPGETPAHPGASGADGEPVAPDLPVPPPDPDVLGGGGVPTPPGSSPAEAPSTGPESSAPSVTLNDEAGSSGNAGG